jgi:zinc protease
MSLALLCLSALATAADPLPAAASTFPWPIDHRELQNGLDVTVISMPTPGVVALGVWMSVGSRDEVDAGRTGFAHFFEHLMFHGTATLPGDERDREILRLGADDNAWTWLDETVYHLALPAGSLSKALAIEADRFTGLSLTADGVRREAGAVYGEYRKGQADPDQVMYEALQRTAFTRHTYGHDTIGYEADIAAMPDKFAEAMAFFDRWYRPQHAHVYVVGDVQAGPTHDAVAAAFGAWSRGTATPARPPTPEPPQKGERRVEVPWSGSGTPRLMLAWRIPEHDAPDSAALELASELLLAPTGDLQRVLVREKRVAYDVSGWRDSTVDPGLFRIEVELVSAGDLPAVEAEVRSIVARLGEAPDAEALEAVRTAGHYSTLTSLTDPMTVLEVVGWQVRRGLDPGRWLASLDAVTADDVARVVRTHLVDDQLTVATLSPAEASP